jgi:hypothetical protein
MQPQSWASCVPNPEIPGGHIALIETNKDKWQVALDSLERMHPSRGKQAAFNQRILKTKN